MARLIAARTAKPTKSWIARAARAAGPAFVLATMSLSAPASAATTTISNAAWVDHLTSYNSTRWEIDAWANPSWELNDWQTSQIAYGVKGMVDTLNKTSTSPSGYASGEIQSRAFAKYGYFEVRMQVASGVGLDTAFYTYTGTSIGAATNNEIDVEFLGKNTRAVALNYHNGAGQVPITVNLAFDASAAPHLYAFDWEPTYIKWYIDNKLVLTQTGKSLALPAEPQKLLFDLWGSTSAGPVAWMGAFKWAGHPVTAEVACISYSPNYTGKTVC